MLLNHLLQMETHSVRNTSQGTDIPSTKERELEVEGRELMNLDADILAEVFSYLPRVELFEVMSVSRHWKQATMEGRKLCRCSSEVRHCGG